MNTPYETPCPSCGAPPERVTKKQLLKGDLLDKRNVGEYREMDHELGSLRVTKDHIVFRCEVCEKRWAEEVVDLPRDFDARMKLAVENARLRVEIAAAECRRKKTLSDEDIKALQQALHPEETSASTLVEQAVQKLREPLIGLPKACEIAAENQKLRKMLHQRHEAIKYHRDAKLEAQKENKKLRDENAKLHEDIENLTDTTVHLVRAEEEIKKLRDEVTELRKKLEYWSRVEDAVRRGYERA
jgi:chromosome segregation ATPase